jgi:hypothetical protein
MSRAASMPLPHGEFSSNLGNIKKVTNKPVSSRLKDQLLKLVELINYFVHKR